MTDAPFARRRHALGPVDLVPLGPEAIPALAAGVAALDPWKRIGVAPEAWATRMAKTTPGGHRFVLEREGAAVGYLSIRHPFMRGPYLETIAVFAEARGHGIARAVIDWMAAEAAKDGERELWLCVTEWNAPARAAYAALGFVEVAPLADLVAEGQSEIFMRRTLAAPTDLR